MDGTSLSAPQVAGAAAVLWAKDMSKSSDFIRQLLNASANRSIGTGEEYGNGLLDVRHAFEIYDDFEESYVPGVFEYAGIVENTEPYVAGDEPGYVVGSWSSTQHDASINQGTGYTSIQLKNMRKVSAFLDIASGSESARPNQEVFFNSNNANANFHGGRNLGSSSRRETTNYVGDLIVLYQLAVALKGMDKNSDLDAQKKMAADIIKKMEETTSYDSFYTFDEKIDKLLEVSIETGRLDPNQTVEQNTYKILGAALHMAGDVYAHRSMVPTSSVQNIEPGSASTGISGNYYILAHFGTKPVCSDSKIEETTYNALKGGEYGNEEAKCEDKSWACYVNGVERGLMEFKDIERFTTGNCRNKYEDNANFYKSRFSIGTNYTTNYILDSFQKGEALGERLFLPGVYGNDNEKSYAIRLNALKILYGQVGFINDKIKWSTYSTAIVR